MVRIQWDPIYSVHVRVIDEQHKRFFGVINELDETIRRGSAKDELEGVFKELIAYARMHFGTEEMYFARFGYEDAPAHKAAHKKLMDELADLYRRFGENPRILSHDLAEFLFEWLSKHTVHMDKGYTECFNEHGLV